MNILIDTIRIAGFRGIKNLEMSLPRVTVLIGTNNSGKTSLLKAFQLALGDYSRYLSEEDFHIGADDKRISEIIVDVRIVPIDGDGIRTQRFNEEWTTEFGDKIQAEANGSQFVALRTRAAPNTITGVFESRRFILERWPDLEIWQTDKIKETKMLTRLESMPFISIEAQRDIHQELKERTSFIGKVLSSVEGEYNPAEIAELESLIEKVNDEAIDKSNVLQNLKTHLEKLNQSFQGSGSAEITPFPKKIRDLSKHFSIHFGETSNFFSWDEIPGNDSERFLEFLNQNFSTDWIKKAKIEKIDDDSVRVFFENNYISLSLNNEKTKVNLKIDDGRMDNFIVKTENGKQIIYENSSGTFSMEYHGMGTRSWASMLTVKAFTDLMAAKHKKEDEPFFPILAAEEPEAHLHPNAQKTLYRQLTESRGQVIVSTHSPYLAATADQSELRYLKKSSDCIVAKHLSIQCGTEDFRRLQREVIHSRGEIIFSKALVLCEGETEEQALPILFQKFFSNEAFVLGVNFIGVGGSGRQYLPFLTFARDFSIPVFIFSDGEDKTTKNLKKYYEEVFGHLFSWHEIPGNDRERLIDFLRLKFSIDWVESAIIEKIDNGKAIRVYAGKNSLLLKLNDEKTKINIEIDDGRADEFNAKTENDKLNIYSKTDITKCPNITILDNTDFEGYLISSGFKHTIEAAIKELDGADSISERMLKN